MEDINRRNFLKTIALGLSVGALGTSSVKAADNTLSEDRIGILVDTAECVGCRRCEWACRIAHNIPTDDMDSYSNKDVYNKYRRTENNSLTVINQFENEKNPLLPVYVKQQCMHCERPACVSACIVGAFTKLGDGSVVWNNDKCIGCRYCMVACQFEIPTFDYDRSIDPRIHKCDLCYDRRKNGQLPACVNICPNEALIFGKRSEVLKIARDRIKRKPDVYVNHIYGEHEIGGTTWLYIASKEFEELKMPALGNNPAPGISESIQHGIFAYFVPPVTLYGMLGLIMWITKQNKKHIKEENDEALQEEKGESL